MQNRPLYLNFWFVLLCVFTLFTIGFAVWTLSRNRTATLIYNENKVDQNITISPSMGESNNQGASNNSDSSGLVNENSTFQPSQVRSEVISAIFSERYEQLVEFMVLYPTVRVESIDCCGEIRNTDVASELARVRGGGTWSFLESDEKIQILKITRPDFYKDKDAIVGVSSVGYGVSFQLDNQGRINTISIITNIDELTGGSATTP